MERRAEEKISILFASFLHSYIYVYAHIYFLIRQKGKESEFLPFLSHTQLEEL